MNTNKGKSFKDKLTAVSPTQREDAISDASAFKSRLTLKRPPQFGNVNSTSGSSRAGPVNGPIQRVDPPTVSSNRSYLKYSLLICGCVILLLGVLYVFKYKDQFTDFAQGGEFASESSKKNRKFKKAIEAVLAKDRERGADDGPSDVVQRMKAIELSSCPPDFQAAYLKHIYAWEDLVTVANEYAQFKKEREGWSDLIESAVRGFFGDPLGKAIEINTASNEINARFKQTMESIKLTYREVQLVSVSYGARVN